MEDKVEEKTKVLEAIGHSVLATHHSTLKIYELQETLSKWLLGGAIAIIFAIFSNPEQMFNYYNVWFVKVLIILLIISIWNGLLYIWSHQIDKSLKNSESLKKILEEKAETESRVAKLSEIDFDDPKSLGSAYGNKANEIFMNHLRKSKKLGYQILFLSISLIGILFQLIFMV